ncbi:hypothetical protein ACJJTC_011988 [Scirpophaga incertulas]
MVGQYDVYCCCIRGSIVYVYCGQVWQKSRHYCHGCTSSVALIIARACGGVPAGGCFNLIPMYVKEISQDNIRGALVSLTMMFQNIGLLVMYAMGGYMDYNLVLWIALGVPTVTIIFMIIAPESPAFLVKKEKLEEAAATIAKLRGLPKDHKIVVNEIEIMKNEEMHFKDVQKVSFSGILKTKAWCKSFILCMLMLTALDANGYFTILHYAWTIMTQSGVTVNPELQTLSIPALMILGSVVSMSLVERLGRKPLLSAAFVISALSMACLGTVLLAQKQGTNVPSWVAVVSIVASVWAYAAGILPMTYVVLSEIFNFQVRAKLIGVIVTYGWFVSFVQLAVYGPICNLLGMHTMFYIFSGVNVFGIFVALILLPETKGKTVDEIEQILLGKRVK